jgi:hypothetical protein
MSENTETNTEENIAPSEEQTKPQTIQELVAAIDISGVTNHEIIVDLIAGIQQLAMRGTIALGLLERIKVRDEAEANPEAAADADAEAAQ